MKMINTVVSAMAAMALLAPLPVFAGDLRPQQLAQFFTDLPGVEPQEPLNAPSDVVCEQVVQRRDGTEPTNGQRYNVLNSCSRKGGPEFRSPQLPLSLEREKRGLGY